MTGNIQVATTVLGGLALFIYGMGLMSEGLTQVAGARMKAILGYVTKNRVAAIAASALADIPSARLTLSATHPPRHLTLLYSHPDLSAIRRPSSRYSIAARKGAKWCRRALHRMAVIGKIISSGQTGANV